MITNRKSSLVVPSVDMDFHGSVDVTDPAYDKTVWCRINDLKLSPGKYVCVAERLEFDDSYYEGRGKRRHLVTYHDKRISRSAIINASLCQDLVQSGAGEFDRDFPEPDSFGDLTEVPGEAGVDTGRLGFFHEKPDRFVCDESADVYVEDGAFVTSSGFGDGGYKVLGISDPENPGCLKVLFVDFFD